MTSTIGTPVTLMMTEKNFNFVPYFIYVSQVTSIINYMMLIKKAKMLKKAHLRRNTEALMNGNLEKPFKMQDQEQFVDGVSH